MNEKLINIQYEALESTQNGFSNIIEKLQIKTDTFWAVKVV